MEGVQSVLAFRRSPIWTPIHASLGTVCKTQRLPNLGKKTLQEIVLEAACGSFAPLHKAWCSLVMLITTQLSECGLPNTIACEDAGVEWVALVQINSHRRLMRNCSRTCCKSSC